MKIYTKTGDKGQTSLVGGQRVPKCCDRLESYGTIDELNSWLGLLITYCSDPQDQAFLTGVQHTLFVVGGYLATDPADSGPAAAGKACVVTADMVQAVEHEIDRIGAGLKPLRAFVLPGGSRGAALSNVCRTVCRRAERCIVRLATSDGKPAAACTEVDENVASYVNRLSDYLFVLGRKLNADAEIDDIIWRR